MTITALLNAIKAGDFDAHLDDISTAAITRRAITKGVNTESPSIPLRVGMRVWLNRNVRPQYMFGYEATVTKINRTRVKIRLAESVGRFGAARDISCPVSLLSTTNPR